MLWREAEELGCDVAFGDCGPGAGDEAFEGFAARGGECEGGGGVRGEEGAAAVEAVAEGVEGVGEGGEEPV